MLTQGQWCRHSRVQGCTPPRDSPHRTQASVSLCLPQPQSATSKHDTNF